MKTFLVVAFIIPFLLFGQNTQSLPKNKIKKLDDNLISYEEMEKLADIPFNCVKREYPNKLNQVLADSSQLKSPKELHPIFYGCFDWHSACHGYWLLSKSMNAFPKTKLEKKVIALLDEVLTDENIAKELAYFKTKSNKSFERTYGWAWLLKLHAELYQSRHNAKHKWTEKLQPLTDHIVFSFHEFLPKLVYPIRVGEHTNTAFGLTLAYEYAKVMKDNRLKETIKSKALFFYSKDENCPLSWEPSGFDFISPCLQEAHLMSLLLSEVEFSNWIDKFLPQFKSKDFELVPGKVLDRSDGKLVHLDGLNFSRAWCLYSMAKKIPEVKAELNAIANQHVEASKGEVIDADYMGSHWLASFLVYAIYLKE